MKILTKYGIETMGDWKTALGSAMNEKKRYSRKGIVWTKEMTKQLFDEGQKKGYGLSRKGFDAYNERMEIEVEYEDLDLKNNVDYDLHLAEKYIIKYNNSLDRGIEFKLTLADFRRLHKRKTCYYIGIELGDTGESNHRTLDRIDSEKGYTKENTVACSSLVNSLKNELFEAPEGNLRISKKHLLKLLKKIGNK